MKIRCCGSIAFCLLLSLVIGCGPSAPPPQTQKPNPPPVAPPPVVEKDSPPAAVASEVVTTPKKLDLAEIKAKAAPARRAKKPSSSKFIQNIGRMTDSDRTWAQQIGKDIQAGKKLTWPEAKLWLGAWEQSGETAISFQGAATAIDLDVYVVERVEEVGGVPVIAQLGDDPSDINVLYRFVMLSDDDDKQLRQIATATNISLEDARLLERVQLGKAKSSAFIAKRFEQNSGSSILKDLGENPGNSVLIARFALLSDEDQASVSRVASLAKMGTALDWPSAQVLLTHKIGVDLTDPIVTKRADLIDLRDLAEGTSEELGIDLSRRFVMLSRSEQAEIKAGAAMIAGRPIRLNLLGREEEMPTK